MPSAPPPVLRNGARNQRRSRWRRRRQFHATGRGPGGVAASSAHRGADLPKAVPRPPKQWVRGGGASSKEGRDGTWAATLREQRAWLGMEQPMTSEVRQGKLVWRLGEARLKVADVLMLMMMKVKDVLVLDVLMLMEARQVAVMMMLMLDVLMVTVKVLLEVKVVVKVFVAEVLLFSLSSTPTTRTMPQTRPAARVWA